jgi:two-component system sensor histidine kinase/response regulator
MRGIVPSADFIRYRLRSVELLSGRSVMDEVEEKRARSRRVLLVEPYPELSETLCDLLTEAGCEVHAAMTTYEMRVALQHERYDCVLLNIDQNSAPDFGLELASEASAAGSRIIMIPDHDVDRAAIAARGWLQLTKPFRIADMLNVLAQAIGIEGGAAAIARRAEDAAKSPPDPPIKGV